MSEMVFNEESEELKRFQFSLSDATASMLSLLFPLALVSGIDRSELSGGELPGIWILILAGLVLGFFTASYYRRHRNSLSAWYMPPFLICYWSAFLLPFTWEIPKAFRFGLVIYSSLCLAVAAHIYSNRFGAKSVYVLSIGLFICSASVTSQFAAMAEARHEVLLEQRVVRELQNLVTAQETYHRTDYDRDGVLEYAMSVRELYKSEPDALDPDLIPASLAESDATGAQPKPKVGYLFRVLHAQGSRVLGGAHSWIDRNGNLALSYAVIASPAEYGKYRFTYFISNSGLIHRYDYGVDTHRIAQTVIYDPNQAWSCCE